MPIDHITIIMAMKAEAEPVLKELGMQPVSDVFSAELPMQAFQERENGRDVSLILNGKDSCTGVDNIGTQPATLAALLAVEHFGPDLIINAGTAGGFAGCGAKIGDVFVGRNAFRFHDRRIPIPGFAEYGVGSYPAVDASRLARDLGFKTGIISTGNSLDHTDRDLEIINSNDAALKDMEAAAIAWVAGLFSVPLLAIKSVTDIVDSPRPTHEEFLENLSAAADNLRHAVLGTVDYCLGKEILDLGDQAAP